MMEIWENFLSGLFPYETPSETPRISSHRHPTPSFLDLAHREELAEGPNQMSSLLFEGAGRSRTEKLTPPCPDN